MHNSCWPLCFRTGFSSLVHLPDLLLDQQASLMSHEAGGEFERMNIVRCPRGTTQGQGAEQHTGTGLVERHVQLTKLTIMKLKAELQRQGLNPEPAELGMESAMAHSQPDDQLWRCHTKHECFRASFHVGSTT